MASNSTKFKYGKSSLGSSNMSKTSHTPLVNIRPDNLDDETIKKGISLIEQVCSDVDQNVIAVVFHECEYDLGNTIDRLKSGVTVEDGGWRSAKASNKKKTNQQTNVTHVATSNHETQTTSSSTAVPNRSNYRRQDNNRQHASTSRGYSNRRGLAHPTPGQPNIRTNERANHKTKQPVAKTNIESNTTITEQRSPSSTSNDEFEFLTGATQSLTFDNSSKKMDVIPIKQRSRPTSIPQEPVSMHPSVQFSAHALDIQFGDFKWNDSVLVPVSPTADLVKAKTPPKLEDQPINVESNSSSDDTTLANEVKLTTHTSKENDATTPPDSSADAKQESHTINQNTSSSSSSNQIASVPVATNLNPIDYNLPNNQNTTQLQSIPNDHGHSSAFTPYQPNQSPYPSTQRDYSVTKAAWSKSVTPPTNTFKTIPTTNLSMGTSYTQPVNSYPLPPQQQYVFSGYPYQQGLMPIIPPVESWQGAPYPPPPTTFESYPAAYINYLPTYATTPQQFHPHTVATPKYNQFPSYDREVSMAYGLARSSTNDTLHTSQSGKDIPSTSNLSATAATFSHAPRMTTTNSVGTYIVNPAGYPVPTYMSYPSVDSRDNRNGAPYGSQSDRTFYPQQRFRNHHGSWQTQQ